MKRGYSSILRSLLCVAVLAAAASASADDKPWSSQDPGEIDIQANCDLTDYKNGVQTFPTPVPIPDNVATGVTVGPIQLAEDGLLIADVIIDLRASHTFIGDLVAVVGYDENCDGAVDATSTILCRPGRASCVGLGSPFGCGTDLSCNNTYLFDDTAVNALGLNAAGVCLTTPAINPGGCYKPTGVGSSPLSVFENRRKGGCWYLNMSDNAGADIGTICAWSVHIRNQPTVGVAPVSWSAAKTLYN
jgi:hypothetical protein